MLQTLAGRPPWRGKENCFFGMPDDCGLQRPHTHCGGLGFSSKQLLTQALLKDRSTDVRQAKREDHVLFFNFH